MRLSPRADPGGTLQVMVGGAGTDWEATPAGKAGGFNGGGDAGSGSQGAPGGAGGGGALTCALAVIWLIGWWWPVAAVRDRRPLCASGERAPTTVVGSTRLVNDDVRGQLTGACA